LFLLGAPFNWAFLSIQVSFYLIGIFGNWISLPGKFGKLLYLPTFFLNSNFALLAGFVDYFRPTDSHLWERVSRTNVPRD
jgi:hypothetical protein